MQVRNRAAAAAACHHLVLAMPLFLPFSPALKSLTHTPAGSPASASGSEPASALATPQERSPLIACQGSELPSRTAVSSLDTGHVSAPAAPRNAVTQFSRQLVSSRSSDRWLEEQSGVAAAKGAFHALLSSEQFWPGSGLLGQLLLVFLYFHWRFHAPAAGTIASQTYAASASSPLPAGPLHRQPPLRGNNTYQPQQQQLQAQTRQKGTAAVQSAASQIVNKALRFITEDTVAVAEEPRKPASSFDSQSFLDKVGVIGWAGRKHFPQHAKEISVVHSGPPVPCDRAMTQATLRNTG